MVELRHLRYFLAIAENSSFTRAAARLRITQPTLSHQIRQLEGEIGTPLFDRAGNAVRLNEQGRVFRSYAERALKEVDSGLIAVAEMAGQMHGRLTIGVFRSFSGSLLPRILARFSEQHPEVHVEVRQLSRPDMERQLISGELNLAIGYAPPGTRRIVAEILFTEPLALIVGRQHPFFGRGTRRCGHNQAGVRRAPGQTQARPLQHRHTRPKVILGPGFGGRLRKGVRFHRRVHPPPDCCIRRRRSATLRYHKSSQAEGRP